MPAENRSPVRYLRTTATASERLPSGIMETGQSSCVYDSQNAVSDDGEMKPKNLTIWWTVDQSSKQLINQPSRTTYSIPSRPYRPELLLPYDSSDCTLSP
jgi:hypothetical protein